MKHDLAANQSDQTQAKALLAKINGANSQVIPRREPIVAWLDAFLLRSNQRGFEMSPTDSDDLTALDSFLHGYLSPAAV